MSGVCAVRARMKTHQELLELCWQVVTSCWDVQVSDDEDQDHVEGCRCVIAQARAMRHDSDAFLVYYDNFSNPIRISGSRISPVDAG